MIGVLLLGFLMGLRHALEVDHVMAVATLTANESRINAMKQGAVWGIGHTLTLMMVGGAVLYMDTLIPEHVAHMLEFAVGIMLFILGLDVIRSVIKNHMHIHTHEHANGKTHIHLHSHSSEPNEHLATHKHNHLKDLPLRALFVGFMHGLAGSSALILLTLQSVQSPLIGFSYIILFGAGSIIGMAVLSVVIAIPMRYSLGKRVWLHSSMRSVIGVATIILGLHIIYDIGIVNGLLMS